MVVTIHIEPEHKLALFGMADRHLKLIRDVLGVRLSARGDELRISGEPTAVERCAAVIGEMHRLLRHETILNHEHVAAALRKASPARGDEPAGALDVMSGGREVTPQTQGQRRYVHAIQSNDLIFCAGPAGTGKTFLAVALAVTMLRAGRVRRLVLVRPAVEAGEKLGFLPGDIQAKVNPYLRPLLDALHDMMPFEQIRRFMANDIIEMAPLAYMRGRTLNNALIILDEAQNTTPAQMLMFLTRLGEDSKMIVTADPSQVDLEPGQNSGFADARQKLMEISGIAFVDLDKSDIVRHHLVRNIVHAYAQPAHTTPSIRPS